MKVLLKSNLFKYTISMIILFILLFVATFFYDNNAKKERIINDIEESKITDSNEKYNIDVSYPRFKSDDINSVVTKYIYNYIKEFKSNEKTNKSLIIDYELYYYNDYINIVFTINDTLSSIKYHNIIIDLKNKKEALITEMYDSEYLIEKIHTLVSSKYSSYVYSLIENEDINKFTYIINDSDIIVYFYSVSFSDIKYIPFIDISLDGDKTVFENNYDENSKFIVFTFDDGPSDYTLDVLETLELNESSATFFMLGNKMKYNSDKVLAVYNSNSEVGSHTYSHKYLTKLSSSDLNNEINSTSILFNEITGGNIEYLRPPYGSYNDFVKENSGYPIILWNIDTKDWLLRDSEKVYNNIINNACDGCILLMHDPYKESLEALKKALPALKEMGYEIVSVSELLKIKNIELNNGQIVRKLYN